LEQNLRALCPPETDDRGYLDGGEHAVALRVRQRARLPEVVKDEPAAGHPAVDGQVARVRVRVEKAKLAKLVQVAFRQRRRELLAVEALGVEARHVGDLSDSSPSIYFFLEKKCAL
jgi:hypothetical protein